MTRILVIFGTRPEAIKLAPVIHALHARSDFEPVVCFTGQHDAAMVEPILALFAIVPDYRLEAMRPDQSLEGLSAVLLDRLGPVFDQVLPDAVIVQGDTTTCLIGALTAFYRRIPVGHVEAGLRTGDLGAPFPEEANRQMVSRLAMIHFAPTARAADILRAEQVPGAHILVTGNTAIDALFEAVARNKADRIDALGAVWPGRDPSRSYLLATIHRREAFGTTIRGMMGALGDVAARHAGTDVVLVAHPNPNVQAAIAEALSGAGDNLKIIPPQAYRGFVDLMARSLFILSDSGGVQEEAPSLDRPVLVLRDLTERVEGLDAGCLLKVGTDRSAIVATCDRLLAAPAERARIAAASNPYGDGTAAAQIVAGLAEHLGTAER